jgi:hypothetical protein
MPEPARACNACKLQVQQVCARFLVMMGDARGEIRRAFFMAESRTLIPEKDGSDAVRCRSGIVL